MKFCSECGHPVEIKIPQGDNRPRSVCTLESCETIHYINPKIIVATLPVWNDKILLCKRAIEPRLGYWTLPAGFMECAESTQQGAIRETVEESGANVEITQLYRVYDIPYISQVFVIYLAKMHNTDFAAGEESLEVALFDQDEIPWNDLAFTVMKTVLEDYFIDKQSNNFKAQTKVIEKRMLKSLT